MDKGGGEGGQTGPETFVTPQSSLHCFLHSLTPLITYRFQIGQVGACHSHFILFYLAFFLPRIPSTMGVRGAILGNGSSGWEGPEEDPPKLLSSRSSFLLDGKLIKTYLVEWGRGERRPPLRRRAVPRQCWIWR